MQVHHSASREVTAAIARLGRTEDAQFSPDGTRLAVAGFDQNRLLILGIEVNWTDGSPAVALRDPLEVESAALERPHGLCWIDGRTIAVANRTAQLAIFELPEQPAPGGVELDPLLTFGGEANGMLKTPGSVSAVTVGADLIELLVCNNYVHHVSRHLVDRRNGYAVLSSDILIRDGIVIPDGVAYSPSGRWIAVSNHGHHNVLVFRNDRHLGPASAPQAVLGGIQYPHGLRFADDGRCLLVADAGAPFVHVFRAVDGDWAGEQQPAESMRVLSEESYLRGRTDVFQGGPKGIDVTRDGKLMVTSCEEQPLGFFDVRELIGEGRPAALGGIVESEASREALLRHMAFDQARVDEATAAIRRATELELDMLRHSRSWRMTAPLRWTTAVMRKAAPGWTSRHLDP